MGLRIFSDNPRSSTGFSDRSSYGTVDGHENLQVVAPYQDGNPNKYRYNILRTEIVGQIVVVEIHYPDCFTWSGRKVCVYDNAQKFKALHATGCIDPHFLENSYSPIARFEPSKRGWEMALELASILNSKLVKR